MTVTVHCLCAGRDRGHTPSGRQVCTVPVDRLDTTPVVEQIPDVILRHDRRLLSLLGRRRDRWTP